MFISGVRVIGNQCGFWRGSQFKAEELRSCAIIGRTEAEERCRKSRMRITDSTWVIEATILGAIGIILILQSLWILP